MTQRLLGGLDMLEQTQEFGNDRILHDAQIGRAAMPEWFEHEYWRRLGQWEAPPGGRGGGARVGAEGKWFLRHYLRGGKAALLSRDRYFYTGEAHVRSFREFRLLARLNELGLPAPKPVAARYRPGALSYSADLITEWIAGTRTLANWLRGSHDPSDMMAQVGTTLALFHSAGVCHADLNAHNILVGDDDHLWLVDFDRAHIRKPGHWHVRPLQRLRRSLQKLGLDQPGAFDALYEYHTRHFAG